ncbi:MAG: Kazal-type serine protease inhibitor family protein [Candidatus Electrothrix sp. GW3-4]|uniref:Kazal-type serine protease inhibitor family protein n=1 Tax=Candidatus Electrothrix sp. GW3-4 TaxID=3126740 RepID=UPI0030D0C746
MKFFTWLMSCSVLLLLSGCYYAGPPPQPHTDSPSGSYPGTTPPPPVVPPPVPPPGVCGTVAGWTCPSGEYCDFGIGRCNMPDAQGTCTARPMNCPRVYKPVCGCNGKTYGNRCQAARAGVTLRHRGPCRVVRDHRGIRRR